jgi:hypothetical protein
MSSAPPDSQLWQPPDNWASEPPARTGRGLVIGLVAGGAGLLALIAVAGTFAVNSSRSADQPLPRTAAEAQAWEGKHVVVETGVAPDRRTFTFEVSRNKRGDLCSFLNLMAPADAPGSLRGGGGGSCGPLGPLGFSYSSNGTVEGLTSPKVAVVDIELPTGSVSVRTKPLPSAFGPGRYYFGIFAPGTSPTGVVGRDADGSVVARQRAFKR